MTESKVEPIEFLWLSLYAFAGFSLELILGLVTNVLGIEKLGRDVNSVLTGILWLLFSFALLQYAKSKFRMSLKNHHLTNKEILFSFCCVLLVTILNFYSYHGFKPLIELANGSEGNVLTYLLQIFYYISESLIIMLVITFGQEFAEKQFNLNEKIPSGGIFLALTWGITHIFLQGTSGGIYTIFFSFISGIIYVICHKNFKMSYLFITLAFIL